MMAVPAAPAPDMTIRTSAIRLSTTRSVERASVHHDGRAVLVVVEHRDVQLLAQPPLHLEAARSEMSSRLIPASRRHRP